MTGLVGRLWVVLLATCVLGGTWLYTLLVVGALSYRQLPLPDRYLRCCSAAMDPAAWTGLVPTNSLPLTCFILADILIFSALVGGADKRSSLMGCVTWVAGICVTIQLFTCYQTFANLRLVCPYALLGTALACSMLVMSSLLIGPQIALLSRISATRLAVSWSTLFALAFGSSWIMATRSPDILAMDAATLHDIPENELIPPDAHLVGARDAATKFVMFADGECPYCADAFQRLFKNVSGRNRYQLIVRHFPLPSHDGAFKDAVGAEIAAERGKFWEYEAARYSAGPGTKPEQILESLGWKKADIDVCFKTAAKPAGIVQKDIATGKELGIQATPFLIEIVGTQRFVLTDL